MASVLLQPMIQAHLAMHPVLNFLLGISHCRTKEDDIRKHILDSISDMKEDAILSVSVVPKNPPWPSYGSVTVAYRADTIIMKLNGSTLNGQKIKVALYQNTTTKKTKQEKELMVDLRHSFSQARIQEDEEIHVIAMANPPLTYEISDDELMEHFDQFDNSVQKVECFKCRSREYYKLRLTFPSLNHAKTALIQMAGSMLLGKYKLKLQLVPDPSTQRRHSLPAGSDNSHRSKHSFDSSAQVSDVQSNFLAIAEDLCSVPHGNSVLNTSTRVKVTNLKPQISKEVLIDHFSTVGEVTHCRIYSGEQAERYGIVAFKLKEHAERAVKSLNGSEIKSKSVKNIIVVSLISEESVLVSKSLSPKQPSKCFPPSATTVTDESKAKKKSQTKAGSKIPHKPSDSKHTKVVFRSTLVISKSIFDEYLKHHVCLLDEHQSIQYEISDLRTLPEGVEIDVLFLSQEQAKLMLKHLLRHDPNLKGHIASPYPIKDGSTQRKLITEFRKNMASKTKFYLSKFHVKMEGLQKELDAVNAKRPTGKYIPMEQFERLETERKVIRQHMNECERQYVEYSSFCADLLGKLELFELEAGATSMETISSARKGFGRECSRYHGALPMYAYRRDILSKVLASRVTILVGETGSGKSTQLVQYLYEAGLGDKGIIACTQPRKVAAISLAKHVSKEMECTLGQELGYKTGLRGKYSEQTKIVYMTDHTLLNECIANPTFAKYSCLVIDEAHERSLSTDLLLAFIKQCLPSRPDLKVVITSATIDPQLFIRFFGGDCPVISVPGRTYPVETVYCYDSDSSSPLERDYVKEAVEQACKLHTSEPIGDFLVFLTSAIEIDKACQLASNKLGDSAAILPLHGKLQPEDQQKVFKECDKRKIVFATNVAETSVTIPGVKCIIDTGLAKELCFDPKKNMNSLEVCMISKSSAEQRKGRAGRTSSGKCFRLYSEDTYKRMTNRSLPEILRVTLASTVLKLYEFGISDVLKFNFVEEPNRKTLEAAVNSLVFLGAIQDGRLTELGKKMAALPIDPHHSKILFDGIESGIGNEAATAVTISTLAGGIFFRAGDDEAKSESDMKTIGFCHPAGDQITYLHTYYQWSIQTVSERNKWCVSNFISAKSMRIVKETLSELKDILKQKFQIVLPDSYDLKRVEEILPKLYFDTFIWNLSVYLGHERIGYLNERHPGNQFVIFPGSPLRQLNEVPEMLIYEKTLITTQHFLLQVLPVKEEWIQEALRLHKLEHHPLESDIFNHYKVSPLLLSNIGPHIQFALRKRLSSLQIEKEVEVKPVFEYFRDKGHVSIVLQECHHASVSEILHNQIDEIKEELCAEVHECGVTKDIDNIRIVIGVGGTIKHVLMPNQYRTVMIKTNDSEYYEFAEEMEEKLSTCGKIEKCDHKIFKREQKLFVTFYHPEDAMKSARIILPENISIEPRMYRTQNSQQFSLQLEWNRRKREKFAFVEFSNEENLTIAVQQLCLKFVQIRSRGVDAIRYQVSRCGSQIYATSV